MTARSPCWSRTTGPGQVRCNGRRPAGACAYLPPLTAQAGGSAARAVVPPPMAAPPRRLPILPLLVRLDWVWGAGRPPWGHGFGPGVAAAAGRVLHVSTRSGATRNTGLPASRSGQLEAGEPGWAPAARGSGPGGPAGCAIPLRRLAETRRRSVANQARARARPVRRRGAGASSDDAPAATVAP